MAASTTSPLPWRTLLPLLALLSLLLLLLLHPSFPSPLSLRRLAWLPQPPPPPPSHPRIPPPQQAPPPPPPPAPAPEGGGRCDLFDGEWVKDEGGQYPLYAAGACPYVDEAFACAENGRPDAAYTRWRWAPRGCRLPRFLGEAEGEEVDACGRFDEQKPVRVHAVHPPGSLAGQDQDDYDCTIEFVRSHFLVREGTRINRQGNSNPILQIDRIDKSAKRWKGADILVFNTGHWWTHGKTARGKNYYKEGNTIYPKFDSTEAYRRAIRTWGRWIDKNLDPEKSLVFYRGYSTAHFRGGDWDSGGSCNGETGPVLTTGPLIDSYPVKMRIVEEVIDGMRFPVRLLNVTKLTNFRKDGHPSVYGKAPARGAQRVSKRKQDCSHWCLPGVPDAWNELIYASLVLQPN